MPWAGSGPARRAPPGPSGRSLAWGGRGAAPPPRDAESGSRRSSMLKTGPAVQARTATRPGNDRSDRPARPPIVPGHKKEWPSFGSTTGPSSMSPPAPAGSETSCGQPWSSPISNTATSHEISEITSMSYLSLCGQNNDFACCASGDSCSVIADRISDRIRLRASWSRARYRSAS